VPRRCFPPRGLVQLRCATVAMHNTLLPSHVACAGCVELLPICGITLAGSQTCSHRVRVHVAQVTATWRWEALITQHGEAAHVQRPPPPPPLLVPLHVPVQWRLPASVLAAHPHMLILVGVPKTVALDAGSEHAKQAWLADARQALHEQDARRRSRGSGDLGAEAAAGAALALFHSTDAPSACAECGASFSVLRSRVVCSCCARMVCGSCATVVSDAATLQRIMGRPVGAPGAAIAASPPGGDAVARRGSHSGVAACKRCVADTGTDGRPRSTRMSGDGAPSSRRPLPTLPAVVSTDGAALATTDGLLAASGGADGLADGQSTGNGMPHVEGEPSLHPATTPSSGIRHSMAESASMRLQTVPPSGGAASEAGSTPLHPATPQATGSAASVAGPQVLHTANPPTLGSAASVAGSMSLHRADATLAHALQARDVGRAPTTLTASSAGRHTATSDGPLSSSAVAPPRVTVPSQQHMPLAPTEDAANADGDQRGSHATEAPSIDAEPTASSWWRIPARAHINPAGAELGRPRSLDESHAVPSPSPAPDLPAAFSSRPLPQLPPADGTEAKPALAAESQTHTSLSPSAAEWAVTADRAVAGASRTASAARRAPVADEADARRVPTASMGGPSLVDEHNAHAGRASGATAGQVMTDTQPAMRLGAGATTVTAISPSGWDAIARQLVHDLTARGGRTDGTILRRQAGDPVGVSMDAARDISGITRGGDGSSAVERPRERASAAAAGARTPAARTFSPLRSPEARVEHRPASSAWLHSAAATHRAHGLAPASDGVGARAALFMNQLEAHLDSERAAVPHSAVPPPTVEVPSHHARSTRLRTSPMASPPPTPFSIAFRGAHPRPEAALTVERAVQHATARPAATGADAVGRPVVHAATVEHAWRSDSARIGARAALGEAATTSTAAVASSHLPRAASRTTGEPGTETAARPRHASVGRSALASDRTVRSPDAHRDASSGRPRAVDSTSATAGDPSIHAMTADRPSRHASHRDVAPAARDAWSEAQAGAHRGTDRHMRAQARAAPPVTPPSGRSPTAWRTLDAHPTGADSGPAPRAGERTLVQRHSTPFIAPPLPPSLAERTRTTAGAGPAATCASLGARAPPAGTAAAGVAGWYPLGPDPRAMVQAFAPGYAPPYGSSWMPSAGPPSGWYAVPPPGSWGAAPYGWAGPGSMSGAPRAATTGIIPFGAVPTTITGLPAAAASAAVPDPFAELMEGQWGGGRK
jgi:hypothetical protein